MKLLPLWIKGLTPELANKAKIELGETPEVQAEALFELRKLIDENPDFYCLEDDVFLIRFLRVKKYDTKRTFKMVQNYYNFKSKYPGMMTDVIRKILYTSHLFISPVRTPDGAGVYAFFIGQYDFNSYSVEEYFNAAMVCAEQAAEAEATQVCGGHLIFDFKGISLRKMRHFSTPSFLSLMAKGLEDCWPCRMVCGHIVNEPFYISLPCSIGMPMLSKKMRERIHFHGSNLSSLHKLIPQECLPEQLGGTLGPEAFKSQADIIITNQIEMERANKYSFHRQHKKAKKHSICGLEENKIFIPNNTLMSKVAT